MTVMTPGRFKWAPEYGSFSNERDFKPSSLRSSVLFFEWNPAMADTHTETNTLESPETIGQAARNNLSRSFLLFAWLIEISAAAVGILLAVFRLTDQGGSNLAYGLLGAIPFFAEHRPVRSGERMG